MFKINCTSNQLRIIFTGLVVQGEALARGLLPLQQVQDQSRRQTVRQQGRQVDGKIDGYINIYI